MEPKQFNNHCPISHFTVTKCDPFSEFLVDNIIRSPSINKYLTMASKPPFYARNRSEIGKPSETIECCCLTSHYRIDSHGKESKRIINNNWIFEFKTIDFVIQICTAYTPN